MSAEPWYVLYSNQIIAIVSIIVASTLAIYVGFKQKYSTKKVGVDRSSGQIQHIEKAHTVVQININDTQRQDSFKKTIDNVIIGNKIENKENTMGGDTEELINSLKKMFFKIKYL